MSSRSEKNKNDSLDADGDSAERNVKTQTQTGSLSGNSAKSDAAVETFGRLTITDYSEISTESDISVLLSDFASKLPMRVSSDKKVTDNVNVNGLTTTLEEKEVEMLFDNLVKSCFQSIKARTTNE
ncbi:MAG: hypothetical protein K2X93_28030 [Candidatus Obscuribacterales bacterium]|nr:hypothetical protein [Candidatus Obscuribacterales bacterium]